MVKTEYYKDLTKMNTFGMKVKARCFVEYDSVADLVDIDFEELAHPVLHIGGGSNLLFTGDFKGTVLHSKINFIEILDLSCHPERSEGSSSPVLVSVGAGVVFDDFCEWAAKEGLWGVENLSYIPGEVGASAVQNIGAYGVEVKDVIVCVETMRLDGTTQMFTNEECHYGYRDSIFKRELRGEYIITHVVYRLEKTPTYRLDYGDLRARGEASGEPTLQAVRDAVTAIRDSKLPDPKVLGNAGSFLTNPVVPRSQYEALKEQYPNIPSYPIDDEQVKVPAGWLIDSAGWKGRALGRAAVHDRQALVLVNLGGATGQEVMTLAERICEDIYNKYGIRITPEVNYI